MLLQCVWVHDQFFPFPLKHMQQIAQLRVAVRLCEGV
jgi:hypothetical protein